MEIKENLINASQYMKIFWSKNKINIHEDFQKQK